MKVGIDIDGTITACPEFFRCLTWGLHQNGHEIQILTFRDKSLRVGTEAQLAEWGISYQKAPHGDHVVDPALKVRICIEEGLEMLIEDRAEVLLALPKSVLGFLVVDQRPVVD